MMMNAHLLFLKSTAVRGWSLQQTEQGLTKLSENHTSLTQRGPAGTPPALLSHQNMPCRQERKSQVIANKGGTLLHCSQGFLRRC